MIVSKEAIRKAFEKACESNDEFDALEHVSLLLGVAPEVVAEVVAEKAAA